MQSRCGCEAAEANHVERITILPPWQTNHKKRDRCKKASWSHVSRLTAFFTAGSAHGNWHISKEMMLAMKVPHCRSRGLQVAQQKISHLSVPLKSSLVVATCMMGACRGPQQQSAAKSVVAITWTQKPFKHSAAQRPLIASRLSTNDAIHLPHETHANLDTLQRVR